MNTLLALFFNMEDLVDKSTHLLSIIINSLFVDNADYDVTSTTHCHLPII